MGGGVGRGKGGGAMLLALFSSWLPLDPSSGSLEMPNILSWQLSAL